MDYIKRTLLSNEQIVYFTGPHWIVFSPAIIAFVIMMVFLVLGPLLLPSLFIFGHNIISLFNFGLFALTLVQAGLSYLRYTTSEYGVTNQRIIIKLGFVRRATLEVMLKRVESIQVDQTIMGRLLNYGTVVIRGTGGSRDAFNYVPDPLQFRKMAQQEIAHSQN